MNVIFKKMKESKADYYKYYVGKNGQIVDTINFEGRGRRIIGFVIKKTFIVKFKREPQDTTPHTGSASDIQTLLLLEDEIEYENLLEL